MIVGASSDVPEMVKDLAIEFSVDFDDKGTKVFDYFHSKPSSPSLIYSSHFGSYAKPVIEAPTDKASPGPVFFEGVSHRLTGKNALVFPVLSAESSAYSLEANVDGAVIEPTSPFVGSKNVLVSAAQTLNNARLIFSGDAKIFSDRFVSLGFNPAQFAAVTSIRPLTLMARKSSESLHYCLYNLILSQARQ